MSEIVQDFIDVIEQHPELFSPEDRYYLVNRDWSSNVDEIEDVVLEYQETRSNIASAALKTLSSKGKSREYSSEDYRDMLINAIRRNFGMPTANTSS